MEQIGGREGGREGGRNGGRKGTYLGRDRVDGERPGQVEREGGRREEGGREGGREGGMGRTLAGTAWMVRSRAR